MESLSSAAVATMTELLSELMQLQQQLTDFTSFSQHSSCLPSVTSSVTSPELDEHWNVFRNNKSAQSNLARGPHRGVVAHVRPIGPCGQWRTPNSPPKVHLPMDRSANPTTCLIPGPRLTYDAKRHPDPIHHALDRQTDRSFTGKFDDYRPLRYESDVA